MPGRLDHELHLREDDVRDLGRFENEVGHDADVSAGPPHGPEEVRILVRASVDDGAVSPYHGCGAHTVEGETVFPHHPADATCRGGSAHSDVAVVARTDGRTGWVRRSCHGGPAGIRAEQLCLAVRIAGRPEDERTEAELESRSPTPRPNRGLSSWSGSSPWVAGPRSGWVRPGPANGDRGGVRAREARQVRHVN
jgi:hypothetical protein